MCDKEGSIGSMEYCFILSKGPMDVLRLRTRASSRFVRSKIKRVFSISMSRKNVEPNPWGRWSVDRAAVPFKFVAAGTDANGRACDCFSGDCAHEKGVDAETSGQNGDNCRRGSAR